MKHFSKKLLNASQITKVCDPDELSCENVEELQPIDSIIGQPRAVKALKFGLGIQSLGFNIFVSGVPGTGKLTAVRRFLSDFARQQDDTYDWCYVHNFKDPYCPKALRFPAGLGNVFKNDMKELVEEIKLELNKIFEEAEFESSKNQLIDSFNKKRESEFEKLKSYAEERGFKLVSSSGKIFAYPVNARGEIMSDSEFEALPQKERERLLGVQKEIFNKMDEVFKAIRNIDKSLNKSLQDLKKQFAYRVISIPVEELLEKYGKLEDVKAYLQDVKKDMLDHLEDFITHDKKDESPFPIPVKSHYQVKYEVNVLVDNTYLQGRPVVIEANPSYPNLFGKIEMETEMGTQTTDFTLIRKGSLHQANGGYMVIPVDDLMQYPFSWEGLKRALNTGKIIIEDPIERIGIAPVKTLKPEPIPLNIKLILIGSPIQYYVLYQLDSDFRELFKVRADFDTSMERSPHNVEQFLAFICKLCAEENLIPLNSSGLAKMVEYASRLAEDQTKLSLRFGDIADLIREASFYARENEKRFTDQEDVSLAIEEKFYRSSLVREKIYEMIEDQQLLIDVEGEEIGQVNGLSVLDLGDVAFGKPSRITATVAPGNGDMVDIEREAKLGGKIHTKGVLIISGYLADQFGRYQPLNLSIRIVFEQNYGEIDGDSASSAELYAILSALSGVPVRQGIAVTGSVNQKGEIQAIGGVNEKIEGFFEICRMKGLTGRQGVIIPASNVKNLMLKNEVVEAVKAKKFHIWAIDNVEEGIEILTGKKAGKRTKTGKFQKNSLYEKIEMNLKKYERIFKKNI